MIEILCTRSARGRSSATMAWPASWWATISFSRGLISRDRRSSPPTTRSMASSKSADSTAFLSARAAPRAASLTRLARPQQRGIEDLRSIGGAHDNDALARVEAVELGQELIEGLLALVVPAEAGQDTTSLAESVELVDEHDAGRLGLRLLEQVAHAGGADAHEHLDEIGSAQAEERHLGLASHCLGQKRLARARRACEQDALRDLAAQPPVALWVLEKIHDLHQLRPRLVDAGDVVERHASRVLDVDLRLALADGHQTAR